MNERRILIVEDEIIAAKSLELKLKRLGYSVAGIVTSGEQAIERARATQPDLVLMDINLSGVMDGIQAATEIRAQFDLPVIFTTAHSDEETLQRAKITEAFGYLVKPFEVRELRNAIEMGLYKHAIEQRLKVSEERYRAVSELTSDFAYSVRIDPNGKIAVEWMTAAFFRLFGYSAEETYALDSFQPLIHPDDLPIFQARRAILGAGKQYVGEYRILSKQGEARWVSDHSRPIWDAQEQRVVQIYGAAQDITEQKFANDQLLKLQLAVDNSTEAIFLTDRNGIITYINAMFTHIYGYTANEVIGKVTPRVLKSGLSSPEAYATFWATLLSKHVVKGEIVNKTKDGQLITIESSADPIVDQQGEIVGFLAIQRDVTLRKQIEQAVRESETRYRSLFQDSPISLWEEDLSEIKMILARLRESGITDLRAYFRAHPDQPSECAARIRIRHINQATLELFHATSAGDLIKNLTKTFNAQTFDVFVEEMVAIAEGKTSFVSEVEFKTLDGADIVVTLRFTVIPGHTDTLDRVLIAMSDITERKRIEQALSRERNLLRTLIDNIPDLIYVKDLQSRYILANNTTARTLANGDPANVIGKSAFDFYPIDFAERFIADDQRVFRNGNPIIEQEEMNFDRITRLPRWRLTSKVPLRDEHGDLVGLVGISRDITERKRVQEEIALEKARFAQLFENAPIAIALLNRAGEIQQINLTFQTLFGFQPEEIQGHQINDVIVPDAFRAEADHLSAQVARGEEVIQESIRCRKDGTTVPVQIFGVPIKTVEDSSGIFAMYVDISERKLKEQKLEYLSTHDALTGLYNRAYFETELERLEHGRSFPVSLVVGDVDYLKRTNDTLGHAAGDELLRRAAEVLKSAFRAEDIIARIGGDEFAIILPNTDAATMQLILTRVRNAIEQNNRLRRAVELGFSLGVATAEKGHPLTEAFMDADAAMYQEKAARHATV